VSGIFIRDASHRTHSRQSMLGSGFGDLMGLMPVLSSTNVLLTSIFNVARTVNNAIQ